MEKELQNTIKALQSGKTILYPTDTIWGIGCLASHEKGYTKLFEIKQRPENKSVILLVCSIEMLNKYISDFPESVKKYLENTDKPTTVIYNASKNCPKHLVAKDGTIAIRITNDPFCLALIEEVGEAITSTSANISNEKNPTCFSEIDERILLKIDYVVNWRQDEQTTKSSSEIIKIENNNIVKLR